MEKRHVKKLLNICLLITSLLGYMEWGGGNHAFLFQAEYDIVTGAKTLQQVLHPFIVIPVFGQLMLLITVFQKQPNKAMTIIGLGSLSLIMLFLFFIGILGFNYKMILCAVPFIVTAVFILRFNRRKRLAVT